MRKLLVGIALLGLLVGCGEEPDYALIADQLEEQLERVLDGKNANFEHIEIEEYSDAAVIRGHIAALSLDITLLGAMDIDVFGFIGEIEQRDSEKMLEKEQRERFGYLSGVAMARGNRDLTHCMDSIAGIYRDIDNLRDQAKEQ